MEAMNRAIAYLYDTKTLAIEYGPDGQGKFGRVSRVLKLFGGPIDWKASKQKTVTTSNTKAKLFGNNLDS